MEERDERGEEDDECKRGEEGGGERRGLERYIVHNRREGEGREVKEW